MLASLFTSLPLTARTAGLAPVQTYVADDNWDFGGSVPLHRAAFYGRRDIAAALLPAVPSGQPPTAVGKYDAVRDAALSNERRKERC